jgi:hypothetical protein
MSSDEDLTGRMQELLRRERAGERSALIIGPWTAQMLLGAIELAMRRPEFAEHGPAIFDPIVAQIEGEFGRADRPDVGG